MVSIFSIVEQSICSISSFYSCGLEKIDLICRLILYLLCVQSNIVTSICISRYNVIFYVNINLSVLNCMYSLSSICVSACLSIYISMQECGCKCGTCGQDGPQHCDMHLHAEIENLRQRLLERDNHIVTMETQFLNEADKFPNGELASAKEELLIWQEKYSRLHEAHKRVQKVNQNLEDKLLRIVDKCETEKGAFTKDIATLSHRLADANFTIHRLTQDNVSILMLRVFYFYYVIL